MRVLKQVCGVVCCQILNIIMSTFGLSINQSFNRSESLEPSTMFRGQPGGQTVGDKGGLEQDEDQKLLQTSRGRGEAGGLVSLLKEGY